jgi:uncharacterized membrane protein
MPMRLQELHSAAVHYPIAILPLSIGADVLGAITGNRTLAEVGRVGIALGAGSAILAGAAGLIAQEAVVAEGHAHDVLVTHRTLNIGLTVGSTAMAVYRAGVERPGIAYLATGLAALGGLVYSAYLGGHMVYELGVGIKERGLNEEYAPELRLENAGEAAWVATRNLGVGAFHAAAEMAGGELVPVLTHSRDPDDAGFRVEEDPEGLRVEY